MLLQVGEWIIKKLPLVKHIYSAAKQVILRLCFDDNMCSLHPVWWHGAPVEEAEEIVWAHR